MTWTSEQLMQALGVRSPERAAAHYRVLRHVNPGIDSVISGRLDGAPVPLEAKRAARAVMARLSGDGQPASSEALVGGGSGVRAKRAAGTAGVSGRRQSQPAQAQAKRNGKAPDWWIDSTVVQPSYADHVIARLLTKPSDKLVSFSDDALDAISETCRDWGQMADEQNIECGGYLMGSWTDLGRLAVTADAGSGNSAHAPGSLTLDRERLADLVAQCVAAGAESTFGRVLVAGWWHSHPSGGTKPSQVDLDSWAGLLRLLQTVDYTSWVPALLGVIATKREDSWGRPQLTTYLCTADPTAPWRFDVRRAEIVE